jgi:two-component system chemotaxis response regulator CheB
LSEQILHRLTTAGVFEIIDKLIVFKERDFLSSKIRTLLAPERRNDNRAGLENKSEILAGTPAPEFILIGASTGGVQALAELLRDIPANYPPIVIVQHISSKFADSLARQIQRVSSRPFVQLNPDFNELKRGHIYLALDQYHIHLTQVGEKRGIKKHTIVNDRNAHCPAVDELFFSATPFASNTLAILLTGMGKDGAAGLLALRKNGALTIVQDEASCIVFGMPKEALKIGAAKHVGNLKQIRKWMDELA